MKILDGTARAPAPTLGGMLAHFGPHELFTAIAAAVGAGAIIAWAAARRR
jgi:hypothetical protein